MSVGRSAYEHSGRPGLVRSHDHRKEQGACAYSEFMAHRRDASPSVDFTLDSLVTLDADSVQSGSSGFHR